MEIPTCLVLFIAYLSHNCLTEPKNKKRHIYGGYICVRKMFYIYNKILEILNMIPPIKNTHFGQYKLLSVNRTHLQNKNTLRL